METKDKKEVEDKRLKEGKKQRRNYVSRKYKGKRYWEMKNSH